MSVGTMIKNNSVVLSLVILIVVLTSTACGPVLLQSVPVTTAERLASRDVVVGAGVDDIPYLRGSAYALVGIFERGDIGVFVGRGWDRTSYGGALRYYLPGQLNLSHHINVQHLTAANHRFEGQAYTLTMRALRVPKKGWYWGGELGAHFIRGAPTSDLRMFDSRGYLLFPAFIGGLEHRVSANTRVQLQLSFTPFGINPEQQIGLFDAASIQSGVSINRRF